MGKHNLRLMKYLFFHHRAEFYSKDQIQNYMKKMTKKKIQQYKTEEKNPSEESIKEFLKNQKINESIKIMLIDLTSIFKEHFRWKDTYDNHWNRTWPQVNGTVYESTDEWVRFRKSRWGGINDVEGPLHYFLQYYISEIFEDFKNNWHKYKGSFEFFCSLFDNDARRDLHKKLESKMNDEMKKILYNKEMIEEDEAAEEARLQKEEEERKEKERKRKEKERIKSMNIIFEKLEKAKKKKTEHDNFMCASQKQRRNINCMNKQGILKKWNRKIKVLEKEWNDIAKDGEGLPHYISQSNFYHISRLKF